MRETLQDVLVKAFGVNPEQYIYNQLSKELDVTGKPDWDRQRLIVWLTAHRSTSGIQEILDRLFANQYVSVKFSTHAKGDMFRKLALSFEELQEELQEEPQEESQTEDSGEPLVQEGKAHPASAPSTVETAQKDPIYTLTIPASMATHFIPKSALSVAARFSTRNHREYQVNSIKGDQVTVEPTDNAPIDIHDWHIIHLNVLKFYVEEHYINLEDPGYIFYLDVEQRNRVLTMTSDLQWAAVEQNTDDGIRVSVKRVPPLLYMTILDIGDSPYLIFHDMDKHHSFSFTAYSGDGAAWFTGTCSDAPAFISNNTRLNMSDAVKYWRLLRQSLLISEAYIKGKGNEQSPY